MERRIQRVEAYNSSGEARELPGAPIGVPDSFSEHAKLMFDLQALAFASDLTRVFAFKLGRDASNRTYPESGFNGAFHSTSHHGERENTIMEFARINHYHVSMVPYFLERLKNTADGDGNLLDNSLVIYGSPMGDSHVHNHKRCPLFLAGHAGGKLKGGLHIATADGTPMANAMLSVMHTLGFNEMASFGDSTAALDLTSAGTTTAAQGNAMTARIPNGVRAIEQPKPRPRPRCPEVVMARTSARSFLYTLLDQAVIAIVLGAAMLSARDVAVADAAERGDAAAVMALLKQGRGREHRAGRRHDGAPLGGDERRQAARHAPAGGRRQHARDHAHQPLHAADAGGAPGSWRRWWRRCWRAAPIRRRPPTTAPRC